MKCHYEVLGVALDVSDDELKKSYRKLALRWHPDKNLDSVDLAKEQFQLVQQAYDILSDPQERAWYDKHRDAILKGGLGDNYQDNSLDVFPYFTTTCFKGYGDDEQGFYATYREVFNKLTSEDLEFVDDPEISIPMFGHAASDYEEIVNPFYGYWQSYSTKKTYSWLDPYDIRDTPNRRVLRLVEKENKKIRDKAKKERNEEVRNLVAFVRKRDPRVKAWSRVLEQRSQENAKKAQEKRQKLLKDRQENLKMYKEEEWSKFSNIESELQAIEKSLVKEFNDHSDLEEEDVSDGQEEIEEEFYCPACNKVFKTAKSFSNHENSKKHKENVEFMKAQLIDSEPSVDSSESEIDDDSADEEYLLANVIDQKEMRSNESLNANADCDDVKEPILSSLTESNTEQLITGTFVGKSKKQRKKLKVKIQHPVDIDTNSDGETSKNSTETINLDLPFDKELQLVDEPTKPTSKKLKGKKAKEARKQKKQTSELLEPKQEGCSQESTDEPNNQPSATSQQEPMKNGKDLKKTKSTGTTKKLLQDSSRIDDVPNLDHYCAICKSEFPSKNKLFDHLKKTGHAVYLAEKVQEKTASTKAANSKGRSRKNKV